MWGERLNRVGPAIEVRRAEFSDWDGIYRVGRAADHWPRHSGDCVGVPGPCIGVVNFLAAVPGHVSNDRVFGYACWANLDRSRAELLNLVVGPGRRRRGIGRCLFRAVAGCAADSGRRRLLALADERDDDAIGFLSSVGMRAFRVVRGRFGDADGYRFETTLRRD